MKPMSLQQERALFYGALADMQGRPNPYGQAGNVHSITPTPSYTEDTASAVRLFQSSNYPLAITGAVDTATLEAMRAQCGSWGGDQCTGILSEGQTGGGYWKVGSIGADVLAINTWLFHEGLLVDRPAGEDEPKKGEKALKWLDKIFTWGKGILPEVAAVTGPRREESKDQKKDEKDDNGFPWGTVALVSGIVVVVGGGAWFAASRMRAARDDDE